jgi:hypothetical protein
MTKSTFHPTEEALLAAVEQFAQQSLADRCNPAELSRALTAVAVRIGGDLAPAFAFAMRVVSGAAGRLAESRKYVQRGKSAMRSKRKSDRDRRSINVAAERQRSSTSRDRW